MRGTSGDFESMLHQKLSCCLIIFLTLIMAMARGSVVVESLLHQLFFEITQGRGVQVIIRSRRAPGDPPGTRTRLDPGPPGVIFYKALQGPGGQGAHTPYPLQGPGGAGVWLILAPAAGGGRGPRTPLPSLCPAIEPPLGESGIRHEGPKVLEPLHHELGIWVIELACEATEDRIRHAIRPTRSIDI